MTMILAEALFSKASSKLSVLSHSPCSGCRLVRSVGQPWAAQAAGSTCSPSPLLLRGQPSPLGRMSLATAPPPREQPGGKAGTLPPAARSNSPLPWPPAAPKPSLAGPGAADHFSAGDEIVHGSQVGLKKPLCSAALSHVPRPPGSRVSRVRAARAARPQSKFSSEQDICAGGNLPTSATLSSFSRAFLSLLKTAGTDVKSCFLSPGCEM